MSDNDEPSRLLRLDQMAETWACSCDGRDVILEDVFADELKCWGCGAVHDPMDFDQFAPTPGDGDDD